MSVININTLKARFASRDRPTQKDFIDLIDTVLAGGTAGGGLTTDQAVFVGGSGNLVSKTAADARALLGVLTAGTKAAGGADDQIAKNHGALVSGQAAVWDGTGWLTQTVDQMSERLLIGNKFAFYSSGAVSKGSNPTTTTQEITMTFAQPTGATHWTEIELYGEAYLATDGTPTDGGIGFQWNCGSPLVTSGVAVSATEGCLSALADLGMTNLHEAIHTHYIGVVPAALRETFPLIVKALLVVTHDTSGNNWNVAGKATAR